MEDTLGLEPWQASAVFMTATCLVCTGMRSLSRGLPDNIRFLALDFWATLEVVAYFFENNFVLKHYGYWWFAIIIVAQFYVMGATFDTALDNPIKVLVLYLREEYSLWRVAKQMVVMTLAGVAAYRFSWLLWSLEMTPDHKERAHERSCQSTLQVDMVKGLLYEGGATLADMYINIQPISSVGKLDNFLKYIFGAMCLCWGAEKTGAYANPAMAVGHDLGCLGTSGLEHLLVFWAAPFAGAYLAMWLHYSFREDHGTISLCFFLFVVLLLVLFFPHVSG